MTHLSHGLGRRLATTDVDMGNMDVLNGGANKDADGEDSDDLGRCEDSDSVTTKKCGTRMLGRPPQSAVPRRTTPETCTGTRSI